MTREEAITNLNMISVAFVDVVTKEQRKLINDTFDMAIEALKQESCENAISREEAKKAMFDLCGDGSLKENPWRDNPNIDAIIDALDNMQPVKPKERTGWIPASERLPEKHKYTLWCSSGGCVRSDYFNGEFWEDAKKYCYEVTAWMPLPELYKESEDKK